ncbi:MAG: histidine phosphatase family protein [Spirochaetales bacterium]|nr:histidine phosphatase family protein [Spirochaetales bacterium]
MKPLSVLMMRHGQPEGSGLYIGSGSDVPLTPRGREQAHLLAKELGALPFKQLYSSPLQRCHKTLQPLAQQLNQTIHIQESLREANFGTWEGESWKSIAQQHPQKWEEWMNHPTTTSPPDGESLIRFQSRTQKGLESILHEAEPGDLLGICAHGGTLRTALSLALSLPPSSFWSARIDYAQVCHFLVHNQKDWELISWNTHPSAFSDQNSEK